MCSRALKSWWYQTRAVSDLKPAECWKSKEMWLSFFLIFFLFFLSSPVILSALNAGFHMDESDQQRTFKNQNSFSHCGPPNPLVLCYQQSPCEYVMSFSGF
ncbi:hypothetical protein ATANTOWER_003935 [Ataeniobius toweri]|uniref:Uncharacterized protein n=1 Tax=Ataeniobius toweri TaxID=208326 RepID=A0ABU7CEK3_9TELE|nr:hypothetical protein [Ataeniobius toweri]